MPDFVEVKCSEKFCPWQGGEYTTLSKAKNIAHTHAEHTGHRVKVTVVYWVDYV